jgi:hypothetical protein
MKTNPESRSTIGLVTDALSQVALLFQTELRLVRAEFREKFAEVMGNAAFVGAGLVFLLTALIFVLQSLVSWLEVAGLPDEWGYLVVGLAAGILGAVLLSKGVKSIQQINVVPERTVEQVRADIGTVKEHVQ